MICIRCMLDGIGHGPFHDDGTINEEGTQAWLEGGNGSPYHLDENREE